MISYVASKQFRFSKAKRKEAIHLRFIPFQRGRKKRERKKKENSPQKGERTRVSTRWIFHLHGRGERYNGVAWINRGAVNEQVELKKKEKEKEMNGEGPVALIADFYLVSRSVRDDNTGKLH